MFRGEITGILNSIKKMINPDDIKADKKNSQNERKHLEEKSFSLNANLIKTT